MLIKNANKNKKKHLIIRPTEKQIRNPETRTKSAKKKDASTYKQRIINKKIRKLKHTVRSLRGLNDSTNNQQRKSLEYEDCTCCHSNKPKTNSLHLKITK